MPHTMVKTWITYGVFIILIVTGLIGVCSQTARNRASIREDVEVGNRIERKLDDLAKRLPESRPATADGRQ